VTIWSVSGPAPSAGVRWPGSAACPRQLLRQTGASCHKDRAALGIRQGSNTAPSKASLDGRPGTVATGGPFVQCTISAKAAGTVAPQATAAEDRRDDCHACVQAVRRSVEVHSENSGHKRNTVSLSICAPRCSMHYASISTSPGRKRAAITVNAGHVRFWSTVGVCLPELRHGTGEARLRHMEKSASLIAVHRKVLVVQQ
jgi:hypothetical protein